MAQPHAPDPGRCQWHGITSGGVPVLFERTYPVPTSVIIAGTISHICTISEPDGAIATEVESRFATRLRVISLEKPSFALGAPDARYDRYRPW